jgi:hypothetical protein
MLPRGSTLFVPEGHTVYQSDHVSTCKTHGDGGALIAFPVGAGMTWNIALFVSGSSSPLPMAPICSPDVRPQAIADYFRHLENTLDTNSFRIILLGDFNAPGFKWVRGSSLPNCCYYSKLKGDAIYTSACLLGLRQLIKLADSRNLLDLVFANFPI